MLERTTQPKTLIEKLERESDRLHKLSVDFSHDTRLRLINEALGIYRAIDIVKKHQGEDGSDPYKTGFYDGVGDRCRHHGCNWIPVSARLPSDGVKVLTWHPRKEKFFTATYDGDLKIWLENGLPYSSNFLDSITHWCELPQPPSEVQDAI